MREKKPILNTEFTKAAKAIKEASGMVIGAGAGFGVDSGLPDFRGDTGFWNAYPPYRKKNLSFIELANPKWFESDPKLAWGFYGHRTSLYRETEPHVGFQILKKWSEAMDVEAAIFTSNVDGHFQKAGFKETQVFEVHGSIHYHQCISISCQNIWPFAGSIDIDDDFNAVGELPRCDCGQLSRPNILMFNDFSFLGNRVNAQQERYSQWLNRVRDQKIVIIEVGAGTTVPTVRYNSEQLVDIIDATVIRINLREPEGKTVVSLGGPSLDILLELDARL